MAHNHKYGRITTEKGTIAEDEPVFIIRARDPLAQAMINSYLNKRTSAGAPAEIKDDLVVALKEVAAWQEANGTKTSDTLKKRNLGRR